MGVDPDPKAGATGGKSILLRKGMPYLVVALVLGGLFLLLELVWKRPDFYQPARGALSESALFLSRSFGDEKELSDKLQAVHRHLADAAAMLSKAEELDPDDKREIENLRLQLQELEDSDRMRSTDPEALRHRYQDLIEQINTLTRKLEHSSG